MKRPISLTTAAVLLFLTGLSGIVADCVRVHGFELVPSYSLFNMIAGVGLLKLWRSARIYSLVVAFAGMVGALVGVYVSLAPDNIIPHQILMGGNNGFAFVVQNPAVIPSLFAACAILAGWMFYVLNRRDVRELFQRKTNLPTPSF